MCTWYLPIQKLDKFHTDTQQIHLEWLYSQHSTGDFFYVHIQEIYILGKRPGKKD